MQLSAFLRGLFVFHNNKSGFAASGQVPSVGHQQVPLVVINTHLGGIGARLSLVERNKVYFVESYRKIQV